MIGFRNNTGLCPPFFYIWHKTGYPHFICYTSNLKYTGKRTIWLRTRSLPNPNTLCFYVSIYGIYWGVHPNIVTLGLLQEPLTNEESVKRRSVRSISLWDTKLFLYQLCVVRRDPVTGPLSPRTLCLFSRVDGKGGGDRLKNGDTVFNWIHSKSDPYERRFFRESNLPISSRKLSFVPSTSTNSLFQLSPVFRNERFILLSVLQSVFGFVPVSPSDSDHRYTRRLGDSYRLGTGWMYWYVSLIGTSVGVLRIRFRHPPTYPCTEVVFTPLGFRTNYFPSWEVTSVS